MGFAASRYLISSRHRTVGHADGFGVDCVETREHCVLLMMLNLAAHK